MGIFSKLLGYRWSLYIRNDGTIAYAMHQNSIIRILGYVLPYYKKYGDPKVPWDIVINFNKTNEWIKLDASYFTKSGSDLSPELLSQIQRIDPNLRFAGAEPAFVDARNKKKELGLNAFYDVMSSIFEKDKPRTNIGEPPHIQNGIHEARKANSAERGSDVGNQTSNTLATPYERYAGKSPDEKDIVDVLGFHATRVFEQILDSGQRHVDDLLDREGTGDLNRIASFSLATVKLALIAQSSRMSAGEVGRVLSEATIKFQAVSLPGYIEWTEPRSEIWSALELISQKEEPFKVLAEIMDRLVKGDNAAQSALLAYILEYCFLFPTDQYPPETQASLMSIFSGFLTGYIDSFAENGSYYKSL